MLRFDVSLPALALILGAIGCARAGRPSDATASAQPRATAVLHDAAGREVGQAIITQREGVAPQLRLTVHGLPPGRHGVHIHTVGRCDTLPAPTFSSAGGHFNPTNREHGHLNPNGWHLGDLPNLVVDAAGDGTLQASIDATLGSGSSSLLDADGSAILVHRNEDDERTNNGPEGPGNSGPRIACGVIEQR